jgi:hypothetical protein
MRVVRPWCCLCGGKLPPGVKRRFQSLAENSAFIRARCRPSPFLYRVLVTDPTQQQPEQQQQQQQQHGICIPCVNWKRRVATTGLKRTRQPMLQLDQLVCFLLRPGPFPEPDHRCMERLVRAAREPGNPYRPLFPAPVLAILDAAKGNTHQDCMEAWWDFNGRTEFFASGQEARRVRNALKPL